MEPQLLDNNLQLDNEEINIRWAGFWIRVGASIIDALTYLPLIGFNIYNLYYLKSLPAQLIVDLILLLYKPYMEYKYGATLGKMALKIKVVNLDFGQLTMSQAIIRNFPFWISQLVSIGTTIVLFTNYDFHSTTSMTEVSAIQNDIVSPTMNFAISIFTFISCLIVAFSARKQGLHDMIAKTYCIYKE